MRLAIVILLAVMTGMLAQAQSRDGSTGPFTGYEAETLSEVWPKIREAAHFEDINWQSLGLQRAPGSPDAQRLLAANWNELRREPHFQDIDWSDYAAHSSRAQRYGRADPGLSDNGSGYNDSPFSRDEFAEMSRVWGEIRKAARYEDINWRAIGFSSPPGDHEARRLMSRDWGRLRTAERFDDIDWQAETGYRAR